MPVLPREERAEDQARPGLTRAALRALPFLALLLLSLCALVFDLTLPARLPDRGAWAEAAGALRARARPGDAVQIWPPWAERARMVVDALPVYAEEDLQRADYLGVQRLWLLALPAAPHGDLHGAEAALRARGATAGEALAFHGLSLQAFDLHAKALAADLAFAGRRDEAHEVSYVPRRCVLAPVGTLAQPARMRFHGLAGSEFQLRAGIAGERAFDDKPPIHLRVLVDGAPLATLEVPRARLRQPGWLATEAALPKGPAERDFEVLIGSGDNRDRPLCLAAWTTR